MATGVPWRGGACGNIESSKANSGHAGDGVESPPHINRRARGHHGIHSTIGAGIPARCVSGRAIDCGDAIPILATDVAEKAAREDNRTVNHQCPHTIVGIWVPCRIDRSIRKNMGDSVSA